MGTDAFLRASLAPSTQSAYATALSLYERFCGEHDFLVYPLRADYVAEWLTAMAETGGRTANTIAQYKSALHTHFASLQSFADHGPNPLSHPKLQRLLAGISNAKAAPEQAARLASPACQPLTFDIVLALRAVHGDGQREMMMYAAIATATAAALRPSELLGSSDYPDRALRADQVTFYDATNQRVLPSHSGIAYCTLRLEVSKTNQGRRRMSALLAPRRPSKLWGAG